MKPGGGAGGAGDVTTAGTPGSAAGSGGASPADPAAAGSSAAGSDAPDASQPEDPIASCVSGLKTRCGMREKAACSSVETVKVLDLVTAVEIPLGPYGAIMDQNVGQGFEVPTASGEANCDAVAASFGEPEETTANIADLRDVDLELYTVYRPACMREGETYPVITWGNGTCGQTEGYGSLLRYVASYGYVVFASNSRYTGNNGAMTKALDFAEAANADEASIYFRRLDLEKIGAMGHSQGGGATITAASDPRIDSLIIWNGGSDASKPFLAVSGDYDIGSPTAESLARAVEGSSQPSAWLFYHKVPMTGSVSGHLTLMIQPERVVEPTVAWWDYMLKGDMKARDFFVGDSCGLCNKAEDFEYGPNGLQ
jgi:Chlorophyllase enzyme